MDLNQPHPNPNQKTPHWLNRAGQVLSCAYREFFVCVVGGLGFDPCQDRDMVYSSHKEQRN